MLPGTCQEYTPANLGFTGGGPAGSRCSGITRDKGGHVIDALMPSPGNFFVSCVIVRPRGEIRRYSRIILINNRVTTRCDCTLIELTELAVAIEKMREMPEIE